jgi:cytochrome c biogenesis protein
MSTVPGTLHALASVWRTLRSMRTALILLLVVAAASVAGSLIPQAPLSPQQVSQMFVDSPRLAELYRVLGLFDVFGSWWFTLTYVLLLLSLASCLVPRFRGLVRGLRQRPQPARELGSLRHYAAARVEGSPDEALGRARRVLRRRRYRTAIGPDDGGLAAEKGLAREVGSLMFHAAFFLLLLGVVYGKGFGFRAQATVVEGETFTEAPANYDFLPQEGRFFDGRHTGFQVRVVDFTATYRDTGLPEDFVSRVEVLEGGEVVRREEIRVNHPLEHRGVKLFQSGYGWAPVIEVRHERRVLHSGPVVFVTDDPGDLTRPWRGVVKLPFLDPQVGLEFRLLPDPGSFLLGGAMLEARDPFLSFTAYRGDLRLDAAQSVFELDTTGLREWRSGGVGLGQTVDLPGGLEVTFAELREYTQFQVNRDPGTLIMLAASLLILVGLIPALYSSRRRIWVRAEADGVGTKLEVGGFALQRKAAFEEEFRRLAGDLVNGGELVQ